MTSSASLLLIGGKRHVMFRKSTAAMGQASVQFGNVLLGECCISLTYCIGLSVTWCDFSFVDS